MTRKQDLFASKARTVARISGQTYRGKQRTSPALLKLKGLPEAATPAEVVRDSLGRAKAIAAGTLVPMASKEEIRRGKGILSAIVRAKGIF